MLKGRCSGCQYDYAMIFLTTFVRSTMKILQGERIFSPPGSQKTTTIPPASGNWVGRCLVQAFHQMILFNSKIPSRPLRGVVVLNDRASSADPDYAELPWVSAVRQRLSSNKFGITLTFLRLPTGLCLAENTVFVQDWPPMLPWQNHLSSYSFKFLLSLPS